MKNKILHILAGLIIGLAIVHLSSTGFNYYLLHHQNLRFQHPRPKLTKIIPLLKTLDINLKLTANVVWYTVVEYETGKAYLAFFGYDEKEHIETIRLMDYKKRDKYISITREEYLKRFDDPSYYYQNQMEKTNGK